MITIQSPFMQTETKKPGITAGGAILARLKAVGVDYIFANSGTDFPPIIEGLAEAKAKHIPLPTAIVIPHDARNAARDGSSSTEAALNRR